MCFSTSQQCQDLLVILKKLYDIACPPDQLTIVLNSAALPTADSTPILLVDPMGLHRDFKIYVRNQSVWSIIIMYYYKRIGISGFDQATGGHLSLLQTYIDTIKRDKARKSGTFQRGLVLHLSQLQSMQLYRRFQIARRYSFP